MTNNVKESSESYLRIEGHQRKTTDMRAPAEYVIRIFKGKYPRLNLIKNSFKNKKICDIGCGCGRHMIFLKTLLENLRSELL